METAVEIESLRQENTALRERMAALLETRQAETHQTTDGTARRFYSLAAIWKTMTLHVSDVSEKCSHPAYVQIIAMGPSALPFIFRELEREPDSWFVALRALTGTNPVPVNSRYSLRETVNAWLEWAEQNGHYRRPVAEDRLSKP